MTIVSICALSIVAAQVEGPKVMAHPGWSSKAEAGKVTFVRGLDDGLGSASIVLLTSESPADLDKELFQRGVLSANKLSPKFKFLNDKGAEFNMQVVKTANGSPKLLLNTPSGDGFKNVLVDMPNMGGADELLREVSGMIGPWLAETKGKSGSWQSPDGKSKSGASAQAQGDNTHTLVDGNAGDGWSWSRSSSSSSSQSSQSNSDQKSSVDEQVRSMMGGGQDSSVAIDPGTGAMSSGPVTKDPTGVAPGGMIFNGSTLRLPIFPRDDKVKFDLNQDGSFTLTPSSEGAKAVKGRCVDELNGYKLVDSAGKPLGLFMQILQTDQGPVVSLNGLLLHRGGGGSSGSGGGYGSGSGF